MAAHGYWQDTWEAGPGRHPSRKAKPERRRNRQAAQRQCEVLLPNATEETGRPPQRTAAPRRAADLPARGPPRAEIPKGGAGQPENQRTSAPANRLPDMAASGSDKALDAGHPGTGPGRPMLDDEHAAGLPAPTAHEAQSAGHAGAAPSTAPAHRSNAGELGNAASGEAPPQVLPGAHAKSEARATTPNMPKCAADRGTSPGGRNRDDDSFDAFMESCRSKPHTDPTSAAPPGLQEPRGDHTGGTPLTVSRQAHL